MTNPSRLKAKWISGASLSLNEIASLRELSRTGESLEREEARVLLRCVEGNAGWDAHTRQLQSKRTFRMMQARTVKLA